MATKNAKNTEIEAGPEWSSQKTFLFSAIPITLPFFVLFVFFVANFGVRVEFSARLQQPNPMKH